MKTESDVPFRMEVDKIATWQMPRSLYTTGNYNLLRNPSFFNHKKEMWYPPYFYLLDKLCDKLSDAVLDAHLRIGPDDKVAYGKYNTDRKTD